MLLRKLAFMTPQPTKLEGHVITGLLALRRLCRVSHLLIGPILVDITGVPTGLLCNLRV